jgi:hypothetical protein
MPEFLADASGDDTENRRSANIDSHENNGVESATGGNIGQRSRGAPHPSAFQLLGDGRLSGRVERIRLSNKPLTQEAR